jgi:hypothetical protein
MHLAAAGATRAAEKAALIDAHDLAKKPRPLLAASSRMPLLATDSLDILVKMVKSSSLALLKKSSKGTSVQAPWAARALGARAA